MAFLLNDGTPAPYSQADQWQKMDPSARADLKAAYAQAGIKLFVSVGGETEHPTTDGLDAKDTASTIAEWVKDYGVDGVDDMDAMTKGTAEQWLNGDYLISHARKTAIHSSLSVRFSAPRSDMPGGGYHTIHNAVGDMINWFYNYTTCDNLLIQSGSYLSQSSLFEISADAQVPLEKIVIGKPAAEADAGSGYMDADTLGTCVQQAAQQNWSAWLSSWSYSDGASEFMQQARAQAFPLST
ncbi:glycoside hydrolase superfamily [Mycena epipterygia]|nr:glycoside hydrolase superfamily [Mycena epipterygia]